MALIYAYKNRGITKDISVLNGCGHLIIPGINDKMRVIIGRESKLDTDEAVLVVVSGEPTENGSTFTKNHPSPGVNRLRLDASDLTFPAGTYTLSVDLFDAQDENEWKEVSRQVFTLADT